MTPPGQSFQTGPASTKILEASGVANHDSPYHETPDHLTFDELRELPMRMALGFDTSYDH